jgi:hypothetical protein
MIWLLPHSLQHARPLTHGEIEKERQLAEMEVRGAKSYDAEKAWSSINHSILYVYG